MRAVNALEAALLGCVQGLAEFLPVSSSGHLVMGAALLGRAQGGIAFEIAAHLGTLLAVLLHYRARAGALARGALRADAAALGYLGRLALASLPAVAAALLWRAEAEALFAAPWVAGAALLFTGTLLCFAHPKLLRALRGGHAPAAEGAPGWAVAFAIGCAQALAITPGVSRSGATVVAALLLGMRAPAAAEFSLLLGAVAMAGAGLLALPDFLAAPAAAVHAFLLGGAFAFVSGLLAIRVFVRLLEARRFHYFAAYCYAAGAAFLSWLWLRG